MTAPPPPSQPLFLLLLLLFLRPTIFIVQAKWTMESHCSWARPVST
jgi:hypothetical protein